METSTATIQPGVRVVRAQRFVEGGGFVVHRPFPVQELSEFDPILLIDEMGPIVYGPGEAIGAPDHPHRGFETVTYIIDGAMEHEDSHGHRGTIRSGDVQWMTAGAGVIHSEMPEREMLERGGRMHGFQIWLNLPKDRKMTQPRYQEYASDRLPIVTSDGCWVRVIAGEAGGLRSPIDVPTTMLHVRLEPRAQAAFAIPAKSNAVVYAIDGGATVAGHDLAKRDVALIERWSAQLALAAGSGGFDGLVIAGAPIGEPVARHGPFVMNTRAELLTAFEDYQAGRFGAIARTT
ncbi:MAG: pirin family protein [Candidatus Velthaea sp.]